MTPSAPSTEARVELERLAAEQAALRRVATLVAQGARPIGAGPEPLFRAGEASNQPSQC